MLVGIFIIFIGVLYLISTVYPEFVVHYGLLIAVFVIVVSIYRILKEKRFELFNGFLLLGGTWYILTDLEILEEPYTNIFWPLVVIMVGISIVLDSKRFKQKIQKQVVEREGFITYNGVFGGVEEKVKAKDFKGCKVYSVFGGCDLDLRDIKITEDVAIDVYSIFGGTTLLLPDEYQIVLNSTAILGGNENKAKSNDEGKHTIYINAISIFGGCDLK